MKFCSSRCRDNQAAIRLVRERNNRALDLVGIVQIDCDRFHP